MKSRSAAAERSKALDAIARAVRRGRTFFLAGHQKPDGDTLGCALAFAGLLRRLGKRADIYSTDPVPEILRFLPGAARVKVARRVAKKYDVAVIFECADAARMGDIIDLDKQARTVINIDHHLHHNYFGDINLIHPQASSNAEQLYPLFERLKVPLGKAEATALYVGLVTDTGRFQQENTTPESHRVAGALVRAGVPVADVSRRLFGTRPPAALRLLGRALATMSLERNGRLAVFKITRADCRAAGGGPEDTEDVVNHGLMIPTVEVSAFFREEDGQVKASFRGKGKVDLCRLAVSFGGGGHRNAAGFTVPGPLEKVAATARTALGKDLR